MFRFLSANSCHGLADSFNKQMCVSGATGFPFYYYVTKFGLFPSNLHFKLLLVN